MEEQRCAVVTGGNRGIGLEICRQLASNGVFVILTSRNQSNGEEAVGKLNVFGLSNVVFHQLDINDPSSIACLAKFVQTQFGKLDILINNAGELGLIIHADEKEFRDGGGFLQVVDEKAHLFANIMEEPYELGEKCLKTNFYATKTVTEALIPLLQLSKSPRIVNVSSVYGDLYWFHNEKLKEELLDIDNLIEERIDEIIQWFLSDFKAGKLQENGWPLTVSAYKVSKAALNAYTRLMARKHKNILVNCVHPGYVITDMTYQTGIITVDEGAKGPVMVALLPDNGPSGVYFDQTQIAPFSSTSNNQPGDGFWSKVLTKFLAMMDQGPYRDIDSVSSKWRKLNSAINRFCEEYNKIRLKEWEIMMMNVENEPEPKRSMLKKLQNDIMKKHQII